MKRFWLIPAIALTLGIALGYALRKHAGTTVAPVVSAPPPAGSRASGRSSTVAHTANGPAARDVLDACRGRSRTERVLALTNLCSRLDSAGFAQEVANLAALPLDERFLAHFLLYGRWAETDPAAALATLNAQGKEGVPFLPVLLQCWANTDPAAAAAFYQDHPDQFKALLEMGGGDAASHIAAEWARNDPEAALAWAQTLTGTGKDAALGSVVRELANADPVRAWDLVSAMTPDRRADSYAEIARAWGNLDYAGAERQIAAITNLPEEDKQRLRVAAVNGLAQQNPKAAAGKLTDMPPGAPRNAAVWSVVTGYLAEQDAGAAARWIMTHSTPGGNADQLARIMPSFVGQDVKSARSFVEEIPPGRVRDYAICRYALEALRQGKGTYQELSAMTETIRDAEIKSWAHDWLQQEQPNK